MRLGKIRLAVITAATIAFSAGCSGRQNDSGVRGVSSNDAADFNARRSGFDKAEDPAFTVQTHFAAGQLAENQGALPNAIEQYKAALKVQRDHLPSLYRLGVLYAQSQMFDQAVAAWMKYIEFTPNDAAGHANLGFCHELAGNAAEAEKAYQQGVSKDPKNNPCRVNYGLMLARLNRTNEAIIQLQAVLPEAQVQYNLASMHELQGRREEAKEAYRKAAKMDPTLIEAKERLAALE